MNRRLFRLARTLMLTGFALVACWPAPPPPPSESSRRPSSSSAAIGIVYSSGGHFTFHQESIGVRGGAQFGGPFGIEASVQRSNGNHTVYDVDLSAKYYFIQRERFGFYALAGPGDRHEDTFFGSATDRGTVHLGVGTEIGLGAKAYLRPEVLVRWPMSHSNQVATDRTTTYTLGVRLAVSCLQSPPAYSACRIDEALLPATSPGASTLSAFTTPSSTTAA